jgi:hypothetical protein
LAIGGWLEEILFTLSVHSDIEFCIDGTTSLSWSISPYKKNRIRLEKILNIASGK